MTCTPGKAIDDMAVCCKVREPKQREQSENQQKHAARREVQLVRQIEKANPERRSSNLPSKHSNMKQRLRWLKNRRLGRFVVHSSYFVLFVYGHSFPLY